ncbi:MAG: cysteine--tRNA ligase [Candidatus Eremiobacteraeota bacterium]|nr:cysteine--tRNA ligase [Candidatus Eremiobacteraeota bacterium]
MRCDRTHAAQAGRARTTPLRLGAGRRRRGRSLELGHLKLYNTRTRGIERFEPLPTGEVRIYVCGLTPSAQAHLGHARSFLFFDVLRRYLRHRGFRVTYVQNVTDIDDRSINAAKESGEDYHAIVDRYYAEFKDSMRKLGVLEYDAEPYATKFIEPIQAMIRQLIEEGHAYVSEDGIYYRVSTFANYGRLANRKVDELEAGARIEVGEHKEDPLDFALWKFAKPAEPRWAFDPYGEGRPGWHIECSAMAHVLLDPDGTGFDIHGGGADLIFPHHENEIAQSEPLMTRPPMANFWVHGGLLLFDNRKMAKSLGNFEPLSALLQRHDAQAIRWLFLQTGYRKVMNFTEESIAAAALGLGRVKAAYRLLARAQRGEAAGVLDLDDRMETALDDDMNTAAALAVLYDFVGNAARYADDPALAALAFRRLGYWLGVLGIAPKDDWLEEARVDFAPDFVERLRDALSEARVNRAPSVIEAATPREAIERIVGMRDDARRAKDWAASDRLRDALQRCGIEVKDSKEGTTWTVAG